MLNYARQQKKSEEEHEAAVQRTGNDIDPRTAEHCARTGLPAQNYYYSSKSRKNAAAWKLHLDVMPNRSDPTTKSGFRNAGKRLTSSTKSITAAKTARE